LLLAVPNDPAEIPLRSAKQMTPLLKARAVYWFLERVSAFLGAAPDLGEYSPAKDAAESFLAVVLRAVGEGGDDAEPAGFEEAFRRARRELRRLNPSEK
jgi:hypothetical protein